VSGQAGHFGSFAASPVQIASHFLSGVQHHGSSVQTMVAHSEQPDVSGTPGVHSLCGEQLDVPGQAPLQLAFTFLSVKTRLVQVESHRPDVVSQQEGSRSHTACVQLLQSSFIAAPAVHGVWPVQLGSPGQGSPHRMSTASLQTSSHDFEQQKMSSAQIAFSQSPQLGSSGPPVVHLS
jgi:hypothetical protein